MMQRRAKNQWPVWYPHLRRGARTGLLLLGILVDGVGICTPHPHDPRPF